MGWRAQDESSSEVALYSTNKVVVLCMRPFSARVVKCQFHRRSKGNIRYNAKCMVLHDGRTGYSCEEAMLHTPLEADYGYFWRRLQGQ
jgi:hypothetical protein